MKSIKVSELTGATLDWAVAKCEGLAVSDRATKWRAKNCPHLYSTDWARGGPIIERESITVGPNPFGPAFSANLSDLDTYGPTPLIAAMRCYVASKLGDTIDVPEGLL